MRYVWKTKYFCLALVLLLAFPGCQVASEPIAKTGFLLDTVITVTLYDSQKPQILEEAFDLCATYEKVFSRTDPDSELYRLNHADGRPTVVSHDLLAVLEKAVHYSRLTKGRYDVTICPVVDLWDFASPEAAPPDRADISAALSRVSWENIHIEGNTVQLLDGAQVDLGSIAKGYIADKMGGYLRERGINSAIVNLGGNIVTVGGKPDGTPFRIGVQKPFEDRNETIGTMAVTGLSVVSSGLYERYFVWEEQLYHHILDPATGYPVNTDVAGVTVVTSFSVDGDALSTCLFLLGLEEGMKLAEMAGVEAVFIDTSGNEYFTSGFKSNLRFESR